MTVSYTPVCRLSDLKDGGITRFEVEGHDVLLIVMRRAVFCVANRCSHMAKPLAGGRVIGHQLVCPFHSAQFDIRTGKSGGFPASRPIKTYDVRVEDDTVLIALPPTSP